MGREEGTREEGNELRRNRRSEIHEALVLFLKNNFYSLKVWVCVGMRGTRWVWFTEHEVQ